MNRVLLLCLVFGLFIAPAAADNITRQDAVQAIDDAEADIASMQAAGLSTTAVNDSLAEAQAALQFATAAAWVQNGSTGPRVRDAQRTLQGLDPSRYTYGDVLPHTRSIQERRVDAFRLLDELRALDLAIEQYRTDGLNTSVVQTELDAARHAFDRGRFNEAEERLAAAEEAVDAVRSQTSIGAVLARASTGFIEQYWPWLAALAAVSVVGGFVGIRVRRRRRLRKRLRSLQAEEAALESLQEEVQRAYFQWSEIPKAVYTARSKAYQERLNEVRNRLPVVREQLGMDAEP